MPYRLKGILKTPDGKPLSGVDLQFIAQETKTPVLQQTDYNTQLGVDGAYDVTLEDNTYAVKARIGGLGPQHMGYILVSTETPAGLDLPQLLRSYAQQATAPDYAQMIEEWLAEANAAALLATNQAEIATAQAGIAKSEADRASQITGLDTVSDAIGLAAVPFPDVWIPFSDSLRMISGHGRDVKVGSDAVATLASFERATTATYIDKSGNLRTAAINETRLETGGILLEDQGANLINISETYSPAVGGPVISVTKSSSMGFNFVKITNDGSGIGQAVTASGGFDVKAGDRITYSAVFRLPTDGEKAGRFRCRIGNIGGLTFYNELSNDRESSTELNKITKTQPFSDKSLVRVVRTLTASSSYSGEVAQLQSLQTEGVVNVGCHQLEIAPSASSYIPTSGSAVTRAADKAAIPRLNNDCVEWYSGEDKITPIVTADTIQFVPQPEKSNLRNVKGFFTPLTDAQKKGLK